MTQVTSLILNQSDIAQTMTVRDYIDAVESAFKQSAQNCMDVPEVVHIQAQAGAFHIKSAGYSEEPNFVAVKVNGNFPDNPHSNGLPTIQGAVLLSDGKNGALLAILDSIEITAMRTGAATAVAARHLARENSCTALVMGCGIQGRIQLRALLEVLPLQTVYVTDKDIDIAQSMAKEFSDSECQVTAIDDFASVARQCDVIVTCTPARTPLLFPEHVAPGTFVAAVGADNDDKQELAPELFGSAKVVVDNLDQCAHIGDLHHAIDAGSIRPEDVAGELGDIVSGLTSLKIEPNDIVIFDSTGVAIQDVAAAGVIYQRAVEAGIGLQVKLG